MSGAPAVEPGRVIAGRYRIVRLLGQGGMGAVYEATQLSMDRNVALKLIHAHIAASSEVSQRFHREMQASSRIVHPNVVEVYDYGDDDGRLFLAMEFLPGTPLASLLTGGAALRPERIVHIATQVTRALGAAHEAGIAHRDLKPDNVMLLDRYDAPDFVKVLDFGIARFLDHEGDPADRANMTAAGALIGTPLYMSPEQALGRSLDHRSDFYSLGVMLYEMALGQPPFRGETLSALIVAHAHDMPPAPSMVKPGVVPPGLEAIILRLLAKNPDDRPATAAELLATLRDCLTAPPTGVLPRAATISEEYPVPQRRKLPRVPLALAAIAVLAAVGFVFAPKPSSSPSAADARARLDALILADGDPLAPPTCRTQDSARVETLVKAVAWLHDSAIGHPRPQDRDALRVLQNLQPADAESLALLSRAQLVIGTQADDATQTAQDAIARCPDFALAHNLIGNAAQRAQKHDRARAAYDRALALAPDYLAPRFNLGILTLRDGDAARAIAIFDDVLRKSPAHSRVHLARGQAHLVLGHAQDALADLEQAVLRDPEPAEPWLLLGRARALAGRVKEANDAYCNAKARGSEEAEALCK